MLACKPSLNSRVKIHQAREISVNTTDTIQDTVRSDTGTSTPLWCLYRIAFNTVKVYLKWRVNSLPQ